MREGSRVTGGASERVSEVVGYRNAEQTVRRSESLQQRSSTLQLWMFAVRRSSRATGSVSGLSWITAGPAVNGIKPVILASPVAAAGGNMQLQCYLVPSVLLLLLLPLGLCSGTSFPSNINIGE